MMIRCPKCAYRFDFREAQVDDNWRAIIKLLPAFGKHGNLVFEYVRNFGIDPLRIKSDKVLRLLRQMAKLFESESFEWRKTTKKISKSGIMEALEITVNKNFDIPLENHNYLKKVMKGIAEREEKERGRLAEKKLREKELMQAQGAGRRAQGKEGITAAEYKKKKGIEKLV